MLFILCLMLCFDVHYEPSARQRRPYARPCSQYATCRVQAEILELRNTAMMVNIPPASTIAMQVP